MSTNTYCCNCGKYGHLYRKCVLPIISLGVILFNNNDNILNYLLIQRKDTLGFVEFIRGKYNLENIEYISKLFKIMTIDERKKIVSYTFDELWDNLWLSKNNQYHNEYDTSKKKFNLLQNGIYIKNSLYTLNSIDNTTPNVYNNAEWGFPKGRRNYGESDINCAKREFEEESGIKNYEYEILEDIKPIEETFLGSNNIRYKHIYYIARSISDNSDLKINKNNFNQISEIGDIKWFNYDEGMEVIRPYNIEKKKALSKINALLLEKETF
jgi:8-oxo-dGTP pyrophosphatase MutT (NUDIX family)